MDDASQTYSNLNKLRKCAEDQNFDELEDLWIEYAEQPDLPGEKLTVLVDVARRVADVAGADRAGALLELLFPTLSEAEGEGSDSLLAYYWLLVELFPASGEYRSLFVDFFESRYGPTTPERAFFECCGIRESANSEEPLRKLSKLLDFKVGACVHHESGWGTGEILAVDPFLKQIVVDLENKKDHRIAIDAADSILDVLADDSYRTLCYRGRSDELMRLAEEEPVVLTAKVLDAFGTRLPLKEIKSRLVPSIIKDGSWSKWWNRTKRQLRDSRCYRVGDRAPYVVEKLDSEVSYEDDLLEGFRRGTWTDARKVARIVLRGGEKTFPRAYLVVRESLLARVAGGGSPDETLGAAVMIARVEPDGVGGEALKAIIQTLTPRQIVHALQSVAGQDGMRMALTLLCADRPEDGREALMLAFRGMSDPLREAACGVLNEFDAGALRELAEELSRSPRLGPDASCWLVEKRLKGAVEGPAEVLAGRSNKDLLILLLDLFEHLVDRSARGDARGEARESLKRLETLLYHGQGAFFKKALMEFTSAARRQTHNQIVRCAGHLPRLGVKLLEAVAEVEPDVLLDEEKDAWWKGDAIYVTAEGLTRHTEELRELMEVKIPANFEAVGKAADFGDLSENAEFTSALEEQTLLTKRAARMKEELDRARVIQEEDVRTDAIGPGSQIRIRDLDAQAEMTYRILGPWDGTPDEGVLNYLSPLGDVMLGRKLDEEFAADLPGGTKRYRVLEIGSVFH